MTMAVAEVKTFSHACAWIRSSANKGYEIKDALLELASLCEKVPARNDRSLWLAVVSKLPQGSIQVRLYDDAVQQWSYRRLSDIKQDGQAFLIRKVQELAAGAHHAEVQAPSSDETEPQREC